MAAAAMASATSGAPSLSDMPLQPPKPPTTLSAQARAGERSGRCRASARSRAVRRRCATALSSCNPWLRTWRTLLAKCGSFIAFSGCRLKRNAARLERRRQRMRSSRAVRFHAGLGAAHHPGGLGDVQFLPITHDESLALTFGQLGYLLLNYFKHLRSLQLLRRGFLGGRAAGRLQGLQRIMIVVLAASRRQ